MLINCDYNTYRDTIDAIAAKASPICRSELEAALEQQAEISDGCKMEIQQILMSMSDRFTTTGYEGKQEAPPSAPVEPPLVHPAIIVAVIVGLFFVAVAFYVMYVNRLLEEKFPDKSKKELSKKKVP